MRAIGNFFVASLLLYGRAFAADTGEGRAGNAELPYALIAALIQMRTDVEIVSNGRLQLDVRVRSQNPTMSAADITLVVRSHRQGDIPLPLDDHGSVPATVVPDPELLAETPPVMVVSNQPRRSMALEFFSRSFPLATTATTQVYAYMACARSFLEFEPCLTTLLGDPTPTVRTSFEALSPEGGTTNTPILVRSGTRELARLTSDEKGVYAIPLREAWLLPEVELVVPRGTQIGGRQWQVLVDTLVQRYRDAFVKSGGKSLLPAGEKPANGLMLPPIRER